MTAKESEFMQVTVLQKALLPWQARDVLVQGSSALGGVVTLAGEAAGLRTAPELAAAYRWGPERVADAVEHVDVVRFVMDPMMSLTAPRDVGPVPWPHYSTGFLASEHLVRAWMLDRTRYPEGAECWRVHADGRQELVSVYDGSARGWRGAQAYAPPNHLVGPRARWNGTEYAADVLESGAIELIAVGPDAPDGFTSARPMIWPRQVPAAGCDVVQSPVLQGTWRGTPVRVIDKAGEQVRLLLQEPTAADVERTGAAEVEPGIFEVEAPVSELADLNAYVRQLA